eukprot:Pgem_evm1s1657
MYFFTNLYIINKRQIKLTKPAYLTRTTANYYQKGGDRNITELNNENTTEKTVENTNAFYKNLFTKYSKIKKANYIEEYKKDFQRLPKLNEKMKEEQKKI